METTNPKSKTKIAEIRRTGRERKIKNKIKTIFAE